MGETFDAIIGRTFGFLTTKDVRVIWRDGQLYVCSSPTDIAVFASEKPVKKSGMYLAKIGDQTLRLQPPGCGSCRRRVQQSAIGQMSAQTIIDSVASIGA